MSPDFTGSTDLRWNFAATGANPSECTYFVLVQLDSSGANQTLLAQSFSGGTGSYMRLLWDFATYAGWMWQCVGSTAFVNMSTGGLYPASALALAVGIYRSGTGAKELWVNGTQIASDTTDVGNFSFNQTEMGVLVRNGPNLRCDGRIYHAGIARRAYSPSDVLALTDRLYSPLQPRRTAYFFPSAGGGPSFSPWWASARSGIIGAGVH
jgi:hypothetical protein